MDTDMSGVESRLDAIATALTPGTVLIANLPDPPTLGQQFTVTDGDASLAWGDEVVNTGAGATAYKVWWDGAIWKIYG